jgi:hypothetical protein
MGFDPLLQKPVGAYAYEIVVDDIVRYIGKGRGKRYGDHLRTAKAILHGRYRGRERHRTIYINLVKALGVNSFIQHRIIADGMTDEEAFDLEINSIADKPFGQLWNELPGGQGSTSDFLRQYWQDRPEKAARLSERMKEVWAADPSRRDARFAEPDAKAIQSAMVTAKWADPAYRSMQKKARKGVKRKRGKFSTKRSELAIARWSNPAFREKAVAGIKKAAAEGRNLPKGPRRRRTTHRKITDLRQPSLL